MDAIGQEEMRGMAIVETTEQLETWMNAGKSRVFLNRWDGQGKRRQELIAGGRTFHVTPSERRQNQELAANESLDHFSNGMLQPVRLIEGSEETELILANPNHMSESEMAGIYKLHWKTFEKRVAQITNPNTLRRLLDVAADQDATIRQQGIVEDRLAEVAPKPLERQPESGDGPTKGEPFMRAVTPR